MLSRLGERLRALVRRAEAGPVSAVDATKAIKPGRLVHADASFEAALRTHDPSVNAHAAPPPEREERYLPKSFFENPSMQIHDSELANEDGSIQRRETDNSRVSRGKPADRSEALAQTADDLTVLRLGKALNGQAREAVTEVQREQGPSCPLLPTRLSLSRSDSRDVRLLDLAMRSHASTRLINVLGNSEHELPAVTVSSYMLAPDAALEGFKRLKNLGETTALELDDLVRRFACENGDQIRKEKDAPDRIVEVIRAVDCSTRLFNAITANSARLPIDTVRSYMRSPEHARQAFLKLPNLGRKSANELDQIMRNFVPASTEKSGDSHEASGAEDFYQRALQAVEAFFSGVRYPDELLEWFPPARLANILENERQSHPSTFFDFLKNYDETTARLLSQKNCSRENMKQLDEIVSRVIEVRLVACSVDKGLEPSLRRLMRGERLHRHDLNEITELRSLRQEDAQIAVSSSVENLCINEIISASVSTLEERRKDILQRRYGIKQEVTETLEDIAAGYDVTRERVRQIEKGAKQRIATEQTVKILIAALEREGTLEKLFEARKIVSEEQIGVVSKSLKPEERLAIDLAYGDLRSFLDAESVRTEAGWVQEKDLLSVIQEPCKLSGSLKQRIVSAILEQSLPIRLSEVASSIPDYPVSAIRDELSENLDASFCGDIISAAPRLPGSVRCILILREAGHSMHCEEIRARMHEVFGKDESIGQIRHTLAKLPEALIVERGTYDLYENLGLMPSDLAWIRDRTLRHLEAVGGFVSAKVIFSQLFQGETERFGVAFGPYMLLGIVQDDERFETRRGLMIGLASESEANEFRGLGEDVLAVLSEAEHSMTLVEIANELEGRRDVLAASISTGLENSPDAVSVGRGRFDLTTRAIGNDERQADLILACAISLADGRKTAFALSEILSSVWGDIQTRPLLSFLKNRHVFALDQNMVAVVELPEIVAEYIEMRNQVPRHEDTGLLDLAAVREALGSKGISDLTRLDYLFVDKAGPNGNEEMLGMILGDFGID